MRRLGNWPPLFSLWILTMIDIERLMLELEMQAERIELRKLGLTEEEIDATFEFEYDFGSWYDVKNLTQSKE